MLSADEIQPLLCRWLAYLLGKRGSAHFRFTQRIGIAMNTTWRGCNLAGSMHPVLELISF
jgi:hypothetical protein